MVKLFFIIFFCNFNRFLKNNPKHYTMYATLLRTAFECQGELVITDHKLHFLGEAARTTQVRQCST
jgi:hypothetical protein